MGSGWGAKLASSGHRSPAAAATTATRCPSAHGIKMKVDTRANQKKVPSKLLLGEDGVGRRGRRLTAEGAKSLG